VQTSSEVRVRDENVATPHKNAPFTQNARIRVVRDSAHLRVEA